MGVMRQWLLALVLLIGFLGTSCQDAQTVVDTNKVIGGRAWSYHEKASIPVKIVADAIPYNIYINIRHTSDYKYSNIFLVIHQIDPNGKRISERKELHLARPDGEWLGKGSGNLYSYQILFKENYRFSKKGYYVFEIEQNMRDNPLREVTDAGIRIEKASPKS